MVPSLRSLAREFDGAAALITVYTVEAHAVDEWPISSCRFNMRGGAASSEPVCVPQPATDAARLALAADFVADFEYPGCVLVDPPSVDSPFEAAYAPWPFRFFGMHTDSEGPPRLGHVAHPRDCSYSVAELRDWLLSALGKG